MISAAPYRDRVVHHALCNIIGPLFESAYPIARAASLSYFKAYIL